MKTTLLLFSLLAACVPVEIRRSADGTLAYCVKEGIAVLRPGELVPKVYKTVIDKSEPCGPVWIDWSPDGRRMAFTWSRGEHRQHRHGVCTLDPATGAVRVLTTHEGERRALWFPRVSPDGKSVAYAVSEEKRERTRCELHVVSLQTGAERVLATRCGILHAWAPDSRNVALVQSGEDWMPDDKLAKGSLTLVDVATGQVRVLAPVVFTAFSHMRFSRDGGQLYFCAAEDLAAPEDFDHVPHGLFVFDLGKNRTTKLSRPGERVFYSAASPSGKRTLYVATSTHKRLEGDVIVIDERGNRSIVGKSRGDLFPFWLDDKRVAFASEAKLERIVAADINGDSETDLTERFVGLKIE